MLAHYLDSGKAEISKQEHIIELGAGTALASLVCSRLGGVPVIQELDNVIPHTSTGFANNNASIIPMIAARWGEDCIKKARDYCKSRSIDCFDKVIMADVLYHTEDFTDLIATTVSLIRTTDNASRHGCVIVCYEQRRKDVSSFISTMDALFSSRETRIYNVRKTDNEGHQSSTAYYLHHYKSNNEVSQNSLI